MSASWFFGYGPDEEYWSAPHPTRAAAIAAAAADYGIDPSIPNEIKVWQATPADAGEFAPSTRQILDDIQLSAEDEGIDEYPGSILEEARNELEALLVAWCRKHLPPPYYHADNESVETVDLRGLVEVAS